MGSVASQHAAGRGLVHNSVSFMRSSDTLASPDAKTRNAMCSNGDDQHSQA